MPFRAPPEAPNHHLRALERHGLVELIEERRKGNVTERIMQATAASYVISPSALEPVAPDPRRAPDQLSARWLLALAGQLVRDVGQLIGGAVHAGRNVATFAVDGEVRFASAADRAAFTGELAAAVTSLVAKYHDEREPQGRNHRIVVAVHPSVATPATVLKRHDMGTKKFEIRKEVALDATPEEVWEAIATGPGLTAWFAPMDIDADSDMVVAWEPGKHLAIQTPQAEDGSTQAFEYLIRPVTRPAPSCASFTAGSSATTGATSTRTSAPVHAALHLAEARPAMSSNATTSPSGPCGRSSDSSGQRPTRART